MNKVLNNTNKWPIKESTTVKFLHTIVNVSICSFFYMMYHKRLLYHAKLAFVVLWKVEQIVSTMYIFKRIAT